MEPREFTEREQQVAGLICLGRTNKEIARALGISVETVKEHVGHCLWKSRAKSRVQLAVWWVLHDLEFSLHFADSAAWPPVHELRRLVESKRLDIEAEFYPEAEVAGASD